MKCLFGIFYSPKKQMKKFDFTTTYATYLKSNCFHLFLGKNEDTKETFRNYLTFSQQIVPNVVYGWPLFSHVFNRPCELWFLLLYRQMSSIIFILIREGPKKRYQNLFPVPLPFQNQVLFSRKITKNWLF